ncbi:predicted protein [Nematostella vectensis]|uniref:EF-hand domain-containing protein n=1 Tax=Nematostella vectensis TaxID=45351 RepID=A7RMQ2_NEMVE|nr:myosin-2 essential light chain [Nematostella vectensis]EDO47386.1 predicted protein [Nematostella vectensis]|eukprot:XP_001639449.1 predicted protein [Nematostella vectensis]
MSYKEEQLTEFRDGFMLFDQIGDGNINYDQIGKMLRAMGLNPIDGEVKKVEADFKTKERVSFEEWLPIYTEFSKKKPPAKEDFLEGLKVFDREANGKIDSGTFRGLLCNRGDKITEEEADAILAGHEDTVKGEVDYNELIDFVMAE